MGIVQRGAMGDLRNLFFILKGLSLLQPWIGPANVILQPWHFYGIADIRTTHARQPLRGSRLGFLYSGTVCQLVFSHTHEVEDISSRQCHFISELLTHTLRHTQILESDGRTNKDRWAKSLSLTHRCTHFHAHAPCHTHTHTQYTLLRQKTLDYSANGCTTDHRPAFLQTGPLCGLSVGWKCCMGPRQCGRGGLKDCVCACVCASVRKAEKCSHAALPNERAGQPLNGH